MDDIVAESGLSKGALYWYFKSKDAIILALLERTFGSEMFEAEGIAKIEGSASERLELFFEMAVREVRRLEHLMPLGYEFIALAGRRKKVRNVLRGYYRRFQRSIAEIFQQGVEAGEFTPLDPEETALALIGMVEGLAFLWFVDPGWVDWDALGKLPLRILLDGLRMREG